MNKSGRWFKSISPGIEPDLAQPGRALNKLRIAFLRIPIHINMKKDQKVQLQKLKPTDNPHAPTPAKESYNYGKDNGNVSLPVDYVAVGTLLSDIEVGKPVEMFRTMRNGISLPGMFSTSPITKIDGDNFHTLNSVYKIAILE